MDLLILIIIILLFLLFWQINLIYALKSGAPIVYASDEAVIDCLKLAKLKRGETVVDLGCGNGKTLIIASKIFGAKGIGVEKSLYCFLLAKIRVSLLGEKNNIKIIISDFVKAEKYLKKSDVVYMYLLFKTVKKIENWLLKSVGSKTRIVSLAFNLTMKPKNISYTRTLGIKTKMYLYIKSDNG
jgi:predicted RNA methylase